MLWIILAIYIFSFLLWCFIMGLTGDCDVAVMRLGLLGPLAFVLFFLAVAGETMSSFGEYVRRKW